LKIPSTGTSNSKEPSKALELRRGDPGRDLRTEQGTFEGGRLLKRRGRKEGTLGNKNFAGNQSKPFASRQDWHLTSLDMHPNHSIPKHVDERKRYQSVQNMHRG